MDIQDSEIVLRLGMALLGKGVPQAKRLLVVLFFVGLHSVPEAGLLSGSSGRIQPGEKKDGRNNDDESFLPER